MARPKTSAKDIAEDILTYFDREAERRKAQLKKGAKPTPAQQQVARAMNAIIDAYRPSVETVEEAVDRSVELLATCHRAHFSREAVRNTRDAARGMIRAIDTLKRRAAALPSDIRLRRTTEWRWAEIDDIRRACELAEQNAGAEGRGAQTKRAAIAAACGLLIRFRLPSSLPLYGRISGNKLPWQWQTQKLGLPTILQLQTVAGSLYEIVTGEKAAELKRGCESQIKAIRAAGAKGK